MAGRLSWVLVTVVVAVFAFGRGADVAQADWSGVGLGHGTLV